MNYIDDNRIVSVRKIQHALNIGNLDGVKRLAKFVGSHSVYPQAVFDACEQQRLMFLYREKPKNGK